MDRPLSTPDCPASQEDDRPSRDSTAPGVRTARPMSIETRTDRSMDGSGMVPGGAWFLLDGPFGAAPMAVAAERRRLVQPGVAGSCGLALLACSSAPSNGRRGRGDEDAGLVLPAARSSWQSPTGGSERRWTNQAEPGSRDGRLLRRPNVHDRQRPRPLPRGLRLSGHRSDTQERQQRDHDGDSPHGRA